MKRLTVKTDRVSTGKRGWWIMPAILAAGSAHAHAMAVQLGGAASSGQIEHVGRVAAQAQSSADNGWMLMSAALVLLMTGPGLALFYGGLVRRKNVLGTMMQSIVMMAIVTVSWAIVSYSLAFDSGNRLIGGLHHVFLRGVGLIPDPAYSSTLPAQTYMVYQLMFAIITPALITGAFAERMRFKAAVLFLLLWTFVVYDPMAHMVWGKGGLLNASGGLLPTLDFAGGTVVHLTSGVSALICALYLGKRFRYPEEKMAPHSMVLSCVGACLLWFGWFGFNAGSALSSGSLATSAFVSTQFGAAAATLGWLLIEWLRDGKPSALGAISGGVAGLVAITPASGFVSPMAALIIGFIAGGVCYWMVAIVKQHFGYDDSLDAFGIHGVGGATGALLTGVFASSAVNPVFVGANGQPLPLGIIDGHWIQILYQLAAVAIATTLAAVGTWILLVLVDRFVGLRVPVEQEVEGLDLSQHGEEGYDWAS